MKKYEALIREKINSITPPSEAVRRQAQERWASCAHPLGSLGEWEKIIADIAALTGKAEIDLSRRAVLIFCADNGVTAQGVSQSESSVTANIVRGLAAGRTAVCKMAEKANCTVIPVDMGVKDFPKTEGVLSYRISNGTQDFTLCPAMEREQAAEAVWRGMELVRQQKEKGISLLATGEAGIGNTTTATAVTCVLLQKSAAEMTGRGAGLSDTGLKRKIAAVEKGIQRNLPNRADILDVLAKVGGYDIAAMCGAFLGGAVYGIPVLMDGFISSTAALCAVRLCPLAKKAVFASHISEEPAGRLLLEELGKTAVIDAKMRLGEGTGAVMAIPLLDMAVSVYLDSYTFSECGIAPYQPQGGVKCLR